MGREARVMKLRLLKEDGKLNRYPSTAKRIKEIAFLSAFERRTGIVVFKPLAEPVNERKESLLWEPA